MFGFWVGCPERVHENTFGGKCKNAISKKFDVVFSCENEPSCSNDCSWDTLGELHDHLKETSGELRAHEIEYSEAFLPIDINHTKLKFSFFGTDFLRVSSLNKLQHDLDVLGVSMGWPTSAVADTARLMSLRENEDLFDENGVLYTYCEYTYSSQKALVLGMPLWVS